MTIFDSPVYPIPPSFKDGELCLADTRRYIDFLAEGGAKHVMTTVGTTQFDLLEQDEIDNINLVLQSFPGTQIMGLPMMSSLHLEEKLKYYNDFATSDQQVCIMLLFPERYYNDEQIVDYFYRAAQVSYNPLIIHANPMRRGNGGMYYYEKPLLEKLAKLPDVIGIKEESPSIDHAIKHLYGLDSRLEIIVAGGSMRRYWALEPFGANSYLVGVGSFCPELEEEFFHKYKYDKSEALDIMMHSEAPLFKTFMEVGWHASMRHTLTQMGFMQGNRSPFVELSTGAKEKIDEAVSYSIEKVSQ